MFVCYFHDFMNVNKGFYMKETGFTWWIIWADMQEEKRGGKINYHITGIVQARTKGRGYANK